MTPFSDLVAVITGASQGIGLAIASALAHAGARVCIVGSDQERLDGASGRIGSIAAPVRCYRADLLLEEDIVALAADLERDFGRVDILVHSAGAFAMGDIARAEIGELDRLYGVNLRAPYLLTRALLPMLRSARGQIVFINSSAGLSARGTVGAYASTKHALKGFADALRDEVNADGIRVTSVYPGRTATPMQARIQAAEGRAYAPERLLQPEDIASILLPSLALPRTAEVTDISIRPFRKPAFHQAPKSTDPHRDV
jgi:NAD(P)-dependent dehydrogenase (short-subunit alcohol dehydrogenase family)